MLEKVPSTPNDPNAARPGGIPIQSQPLSAQNEQKKSGSCC